MDEGGRALMSAAILGTGRTRGTATAGGLGRLERDARRKELDRLRNRTSNLLGGGGGLGQQSPARPPAPLAGLGR